MTEGTRPVHKRCITDECFISTSVGTPEIQTMTALKKSQCTFRFKNEPKSHMFKN